MFDMRNLARFGPIEAGAPAAIQAFDAFNPGCAEGDATEAEIAETIVVAAALRAGVGPPTARIC
jgi:hypothetical protein